MRIAAPMASNAFRNMNASFVIHPHMTHADRGKPPTEAALSV
jgi:hypothetical protein